MISDDDDRKKAHPVSPEGGLTQRAPDWWESARFQAVCVAWGGFRYYAVVDRRMLFDQRRQLHRAIAEWYEQICADQIGEHAARLTYHWSKLRMLGKRRTP